MKKSKVLTAVLITAAILFASFLVGGIAWAQRQNRYRPELDANVRWVSQDPDISFSHVLYTPENQPSGRMIVNGQTIGISPTFDYGGRLYVFGWPTIDPDQRGDEDIMMRGDCNFYWDYFTVKITFDRDGLFEGIDTITFRKEYIDNGFEMTL